ncbi:MAG TPA: twin-arginine translocase TatA/TatE family subunit [Thermoanaerobaculia bacterium]
MFGSLGVPEILLIFVVVLVVFGPRRIPEIGRMLGKALGEFRKATDDIKNTIEREVRLEELKNIAPPVITPFDFESVSRSEPVSPATEIADTPAGVETDTAVETVPVAVENVPVPDVTTAPEKAES